jgi:hypothetical protein
MKRNKRRRSRVRSSLLWSSRMRNKGLWRRISMKRSFDCCWLDDDKLMSLLIIFAISSFNTFYG